MIKTFIMATPNVENTLSVLSLPVISKQTVDLCFQHEKEHGMRHLFSQFNGVEVFFLICAVIGGLFVFFRLITQFLGLGHEDHGDFSTDGHNIDGHHPDSDIGFKILSLHGLTSFLMMFGLVGLALFRETQIGIFFSMIAAIISGLASVWVIKKMFSAFGKLQSSGTIQVDQTVGAQGNVYLTIPRGGMGRVLINVKNSLREYDATAADEMEIPTDTPIRVVWVDGKVLVVEKI
jgi:membrane protein implicated in regulation of membrane protease activity